MPVPSGRPRSSSTTTRIFHDIEYRWNFGDATGLARATWNQGSSARNVATGPLAAHVHKTPGTYTVVVNDAANTVSYQCQIMMQDPEVVFAGAKTACFSASGNFSGCPAGAAQVTINNVVRVAAEVTAANSVRRLLLRRAETLLIQNATWSACASDCRGMGTICPSVGTNT
jgi:hypothetical protein